MSADTEHLRDGAPSGRLVHGPRPPMSAAERLGAVLAHHLLVYRRTWKGSLIGRFLSPLFFLLAMDVLTGYRVRVGTPVLAAPAAKPVGARA